MSAFSRRHRLPDPTLARPLLSDGSLLSRRRLVVGGLSGLALAGTGCLGPAPAPDAKKDEGGHPLAGLASFDGATLDPPALVGVPATVVDFWASWCGPCRQAFKYLDQLYRTYQADGLRVIGISVDDDPQKGRQFRSRLRPRFDIGWDPSGAIRDRFHVIGLPTTVLLDENARLVHRHEGWDPAMHQLLETHVRRLVRAG